MLPGKIPESFISMVLLDGNMEELSYILAFFLLGLSASPSCLGVCMPVMVPMITSDKESNMRGGFLFSTYLSLGRLTIYVALAAVTGFVGHVLLDRDDVIEHGSVEYLFSRVIMGTIAAIVIVYAVALLKGRLPPITCPRRFLTVMRNQKSQEAKESVESKGIGSSKSIDASEGNGGSDESEGKEGSDASEGNGGSDASEGKEGSIASKGNEDSDASEGKEGSVASEGDEGSDASEGNEGSVASEGNEDSDVSERNEDSDASKSGIGRERYSETPGKAETPGDKRKLDLIPFYFGLMFGSILCPPYLILLGTSFVSAGIVTGMAAGFLFWLGTLPVNLLAGAFSGEFGRRWRERRDDTDPSFVTNVSAITLFMVGLWWLLLLLLGG